jgi:hypothetical protein
MSREQVFGQVVLELNCLLSRRAEYSKVIDLSGVGHVLPQEEIVHVDETGLR